MPSLRDAVVGRVTVIWLSFLIPCLPPVRERKIRYLDYCTMIPRQMQRKQAQSPSEVLLMKTLPQRVPSNNTPYTDSRTCSRNSRSTF